MFVSTKSFLAREKEIKKERRMKNNHKQCLPKGNENL